MSPYRQSALWALFAVVLAIAVAGAEAGNITVHTTVQKVSHFDLYSNETFTQRYAMTADFFNAERPMFIMHLTNFYSPSYYINDTALYEWARELGAALVHLELRYYGQSTPFSNYTVENLQYQTLEQNFADIIAVQNEVETALNVNGSTAAIYHDWVMSGSIYGGFIATTFSARFPHRSLGVIAIRPALEISPNNIIYDEDYYEIAGATCGNAIHTVISNLTSAVIADPSIKANFGCSTSQGDVQFLHTMNSLMTFGIDVYKSTLCANITADSSLENFAELVSFLTTESYATCDQWALNLNDVTSTFRPYLYMQCTQIGQFETSARAEGSSKGIMSDTITLDWFLEKICFDMFNLEKEAILQAIDMRADYFGTGGHNRFHIDNAIIVVSSLDPLSSFALSEQIIHGDNQIIEIDSTYSVEDVFASYLPAGKKPISDAQRHVLKEINRWFQEEHHGKSYRDQTIGLGVALGVCGLLLIAAIIVAVVFWRRARQA